ncbi:zinc finger CCCH domain-containing protein 30-like [Quercus lobata]|uniref:C3H1-type domain-containing protein n=1 Tax=Quercus lobata TaxID=97700 RepID=A0A7N2M019_QUELO|nr:zinc finger CCCH domain-containing protein 30-like [Quercus lobata]
MERSRKSNKVSWAPGVELCQIKLFSSEDCPAKVGLKYQDHLQAKTSWMLHSNAVESNDLPPGFEGCPESNLKKELLHIPQIKWKCPSKFVMSCNWQVVAGEESTEVEAEKLREMRVLEAVYPRPSATPPSPSVSLNIENEHYDDTLTPLVPITPIEEESPSDLTVPMNNPVCSQPMALPQNLSASGSINTPKSSSLDASSTEKPGLEILPSVGADMIATIMKSNQQGSLIDTDLLIKILSDPKMIQKLINDPQPPVIPVSALGNIVSATSNTVIAPVNIVSAPTTDTGTPPMSVPKPSTPLFHMSSVSKPEIQRPCIPNGMKQVTSSVPLSCSEPNLGLSTTPANGKLYAVTNQVRPTLNALSTKPITTSISTTFMVKEAQPVKDANYYKNLIRQHGGEKQTQEPIHAQNGHNHFQDLKLVQNIKHGELKAKNQKPCVYFNSQKGCRNGNKCPYKHDMWRSGGILDAQSTKRMRLSGEITGRI